MIRGIHRLYHNTRETVPDPVFAPPKYHHSDRGVQYCSYDYIEILKKNNIIPSMADVGISVDNPYAESLNRSIKVEEA